MLQVCKFPLVVVALPLTVQDFEMVACPQYGHRAANLLDMLYWESPWKPLAQWRGHRFGGYF